VGVPIKTTMKQYEIWTGYYWRDGLLPKEPELQAVIKALDFKSACMKYELKNRLESIELQEKQGYVNKLSYVDYYDPDTQTNHWCGKYYPSREEAQKSFEES
jgi:hypothetical protein